MSEILIVMRLFPLFLYMFFLYLLTFLSLCLYRPCNAYTLHARMIASVILLYWGPLLFDTYCHGCLDIKEERQLAYIFYSNSWRKRSYYSNIWICKWGGPQWQVSCDYISHRWGKQLTNNESTSRLLEESGHICIHVYPSTGSHLAFSHIYSMFRSK